MSILNARKVLVLGAGGMLGSAVFRYFLGDPQFEAIGTLRSVAKKHFFGPHEWGSLLTEVDVLDDMDLVALFSDVQPDIVINCVGLIKQVDASRNHLASISTNSLLPHRLAQFCKMANARLVHLSTDCVFSGKRGNYTENDVPDAEDLYGRTKLLGEIQYGTAVTLRTSIIGHELGSANSLIDWFLKQAGQVTGYKNAIFSGLPAIEIARVIRDFVIPLDNLRGLYHLSARPISKYDLLRMVSGVYGKDIDMDEDYSYNVNRSLNSDKFRTETGFMPKEWIYYVNIMYQDFKKNQAESYKFQ